MPKGEFGLKAGTNTQSITGDQWEHNYHTGISGGFWARMHKNKIGVRVEVLVSTFRLKSGKLTDSAGNSYYTITDSAGHQGDFRATCLNVPLVLEINILKNLLLQVGGQYSNLISLANLNDLKGSYKTMFKQGEFSALIGAEVVLPMNFSVGARYRYGISDINNTDVSLLTGTWKTSAIQLFACYKIR